MNPLLAIAALLALSTAIAHSWLGERWIIRPVLAIPDLPKLLGSRRGMKKVLRFAWHVTSLFWAGMAAILFHYSRAAKDETVLQIVTVIYILSAVITAAVSRGRHYAWVVFTAIAGLTWFARN
jgi:hypothetical protein